MDMFQLLKEQHASVREALRRLVSERRSLNDTDILKQLKLIQMDLTLHTQLEEKLLYPAMEKFKNAKALADIAYQEHREFNDLLQQIINGKFKGHDLNRNIDRLYNEVEHHIEEEETELFPLAHQDMTADQIRDISDEMTHLNQHAQQQKQRVL